MRDGVRNPSAGPANERWPDVNVLELNSCVIASAHLGDVLHLRGGWGVGGEVKEVVDSGRQAQGCRAGSLPCEQGSSELRVLLLVVVYLKS